jgi:hypothetical protein
MNTKPALQKRKINTTRETWKRVNHSRQVDKKMRITKESNIIKTTASKELLHTLQK